ncbi:CDP-alcohol phosphatidyltransferase [Xylanimonas sp. McL0601]|uniref:CDP-alcohol phosphatidyltransferase n=1 Tax=Xylanimonas sp. McL0601 TaxID=3414739 RepID=UPI003CEABD84
MRRDHPAQADGEAPATPVAGEPAHEDSPARPPTTRPRSARSIAVGVLAALAVWGALVAPGVVRPVSPALFARLPLEGLLFAALVLVLRPRWRPWAAALFGVALALLLVASALDDGFETFLSRPFDPVNDWRYLVPAVGVLGDAAGWPTAVAAAAGACVAALAAIVLLPLAVVRLTGLASRHRTTTAWAVGAAGAVWVVLAATGVEVAPGAPIAAVSAATTAYDQVSRVRADIVDTHRFARDLATDRFADVPGGQLLRGLRGKDVLIVFVESYGRVAVEGPDLSPGVDTVLDSGTGVLRAAGFASESAWLRSPTFGGVSWLAHSTLQSGVWVDSARRYQQLLGSDRLTLTRAFGRAGWRTVTDIPSSSRNWPQGEQFYGFDQLYDSRNVGYRGPQFSYATMPDQYVLEAFRRLELAHTDRRPVMAEIDLVSSHTPWTPLPRMVPWDKVGDGSVFDSMPAEGKGLALVTGDEVQRRLYGQSVEYSLSALVSFVETYPDPHLVVVVLGDHQPHHPVTAGSNHDVPITVIAHDPAVMHRIAGWGWAAGMRPTSAAPVWPMDAFRDRFLTAFGSSTGRAS